MDQITPVPAQAIHLRNPRRSTPSLFVSLTMKSDIVVNVLLIGPGLLKPTRHQVHTGGGEKLFRILGRSYRIRKPRSCCRTIRGSELHSSKRRSECILNSCNS